MEDGWQRDKGHLGFKQILAFYTADKKAEYQLLRYASLENKL